jgi:hypothetical protein
MGICAQLNMGWLHFATVNSFVFGLCCDFFTLYLFV